MIFFFPSVLVFLFFSSLGKTVSYVPGTEDIPLIEGAQIAENQPVVFDTLEGKVVVSKIVSFLPLSKVEDFYTQVLSNLGWKKTSLNYYQRGKQFLDIKSQCVNGKVFSTFELKEIP